MVVLAISVLVTYLSIHFNLGYNVDLTLLSIAIVFPLVFNIRGAFRRREKALQHLSQFRAALKTIYFYLQMSVSLSAEDKKKLEEILEAISDETVLHLRNGTDHAVAVDTAMDELQQFVIDSKDDIPGRIRDRIFRYMNDLQEGFENVHAINSHRTPIALKAYCLVFIYVFPFIYAPTIVYNIGATENAWVVYFIVVVTEFILISLYNIQDQIEYPFDAVGVDDIKLENFKINR
jgi:predicted membrane chloride channel (bestrophin family)